MASAGKKAGQDDALTNLGKRDIFCGFQMQFAVFTRRALTATKQGRQRISKAKLVDATEEINQNRILGVIFILDPSHGVSFSRIVD